MIQPIKLYNTLTKTVEVFTPKSPPKVSVYCCGPTVYNFQHIGNLRAYIFEDLLVRALRQSKFAVTHVMNITDVGHLVSDGDEGDDKMLVAMRREGKKSHEIAAFYTDVFLKDCANLNIRRPDIVCKATDHIPEMIALTEKLITRGFAYLSNGNVYFDVAKLPDYGKLARLDLAKLQAGARIDVDQAKRSPFDFVLWFTKSKFENQELLWDSPWGPGYPGWHIECSAMAMKYLGDEIDIHCGGIDHIPVHHTNEIAQSEAATGKPWVSVWMHGEFLVINSQKMAKSAGNFLTLDLLCSEGLDPLAYRLFILSGHYRTQLNFSSDAIKGAAQSFASLKSSYLATKAQALADIPAPSDDLQLYREAFINSVHNDLNMPQAIAALWQVLQAPALRAEQKLTLLLDFDCYLGLGMAEWVEQQVTVPGAVQALLEQRIKARDEKRWADSDILRDQIKALGYLVEDGKEGMRVRAI